MAAKKQSYQQLKEVWYKKLEKSGFNDIELNDEHNNVKKPISRLSQTNQNGKSRVAYKSSFAEYIWTAKRDYYILAEHFLNEHKFKSNLEKTIWEYHTNGISMRNIAKLLKIVKCRHNKDSINKIVSRLVKEMKELYNVK